MSKILSIAGSAFSSLGKVLWEHPKQVLLFVWFALAIGFGIWRAGQPFNQMQPVLIGFGVLASLIGYISLKLELRAVGPRKPASLMASAVMLIGAMSLWFGLQT